MGGPLGGTKNEKPLKIHVIDNNSGIFYHKMLPKVANENFVIYFLIFGVIWGNDVKGCPLGGTKKTKKPSKPILQPFLHQLQRLITQNFKIKWANFFCRFCEH